MKNTFYSLSLLLLLSSCVETVAATVASPVVMSMGERNFYETRSDLLTDIKVSYSIARKDKRKHLKKVHAKVQEGRVLLTGYVLNKAHKEEATDIVWKIKGVREVIDEIQVIKNPWEITLASKTKDNLVANAVRTKLLASRKVRSINYDVVNSNGIVYLFGIAQNQDELNLAAKKASKVAGVKKVVSHVLLKYDDRRFSME